MDRLPESILPPCGSVGVRVDDPTRGAAAARRRPGNPHQPMGETAPRTESRRSTASRHSHTLNGMGLTCTSAPLAHRPHPPGDGHRDRARLVALARPATRSRIVPVAVTSTRPPADPQALTDFLGVLMQKGDRSTVTFSDRDAAWPFLTANEPMWEFFEPDLRRRLAQLDANAPEHHRDGPSPRLRRTEVVLPCVPGLDRPHPAADTRLGHHDLARATAQRRRPRRRHADYQGHVPPEGRDPPAAPPSPVSRPVAPRALPTRLGASWR